MAHLRAYTTYPCDFMFGKIAPKLGRSTTTPDKDICLIWNSHTFDLLK